MILLVLAALNSGCGEDQTQDDGDFDRWDACERMVSLCGYTRDKISECVNRIEQDYPGTDERAELLRCMKEAPTCQEMTEACMPEQDTMEPIPSGFCAPANRA
jgi:hypothetical protein